jgi:hypothetical protein
MLAGLSEIFWPFIYIMGALFYCVFLQFLANLEYRYKNKKNLLSDEVYLEKIAGIYNISIYDLFCTAADSWKIPEKQMETAFKKYLKYGEIPYYVRDLVRQYKKDRPT